MNAHPDHLVQALFETDAPADRWPAVAGALSRYLEATTVRIMAFSPETGERFINSATVDWPDRLIEEYDTHYLRTDPRIAAGFARLGTTVSCIETMALEAFEKSALVCDFLDRPEVDSRWGLLHMQRTAAGHILLFGAGRPRDRSPFIQEDKDRFDAVLAPVKRALELDARLAAANRQSEVLEATLDVLSDPIIVVTDNLRVLHVNERARELVNANKALRVSRGRLQAVRPADQAALERTVRSAASDEIVRTTHATTIRTEEGPFLLVRAHRLPRSAGVSTSDRSRQCALIFTMVGSNRVDHGIDAVLKAFGLTAAELKLVRQLLTGARLVDCANEAGVSIETVRSQLKSAHEKVGVRRQSDLIRFLAQYG
jgi:DNA-binding CsgD family transcriptional regulator/PAS domain-containing protein